MSQYRHYAGDKTQTYRKLYGYKKLLAWQAADELSAVVHEAVIHFGYVYHKLTTQMLGSASSTKANIAEGYCRNALGDYIRFCEIARGSLGELGSQIQDCERWGLLKEAPLAELIKRFGDTTYFLEELIKSLKAKQKDGSWDRSYGVKEPEPNYFIGDTFTDPSLFTNEQSDVSSHEFP
jgi:four helix bundle protein